MQYFGDDGDRMQMMFNFQVNQHLFYALASADTEPLVKALEKTKPRPATAQWGLFLRNHDELDLGRLTKPQQKRVFDAFGPDKSMQLYDRGIRRRLAPMLQGRPPAARTRLFSLMFTLPWHARHSLTATRSAWAMIFRCRSAIARAPRCNGRTNRTAVSPKMPRPKIPVIADGPYGFPHLNAAVQRRHNGSLLNWTERIIRMRKEVPEIGWGDFKILAHG